MNLRPCIFSVRIAHSRADLRLLLLLPRLGRTPCLSPGLSPLPKGRGRGLCVLFGVSLYSRLRLQRNVGAADHGADADQHRADAQTDGRQL